MKRTRTTNFSFKGVHSCLLTLAMIMGLLSTNQLEAQCDLQLIYNNADVTGLTNLTYVLGPGDCEAQIDLTLVISQGQVPTGGCFPDGTTVTYPDMAVSYTGSVTQFSGFLPIGVSTVEFEYYESDTTLTNYPTISIEVKEYPAPITSLACNDNVQLSLNADCEATVTADMILEGGPYKCYDNYIVQVLAGGPNGTPIDRDAITPGVQLDGNDFGNCYTTKVIDPATGNSCWGEMCVEDKLAPVLECTRDILIVPCGTDVSVQALGAPNVYEPCGRYTLVHQDFVDERGCNDRNGLDRIITRVWTATDESGNVATCEQIIWVELGDLSTVTIPEDRDDITLPALECDEKYDSTLDISAHIISFPYCVDGYLLDSAHWVSTGGQPHLGDLSGERLPMTLGWNCIESGPYAGHPSPANIMYEPHPQWQFSGVCWGENEVIKWEGTGYPGGVSCSNVNYTFSDVRIDLSDPDCSAGDVGCYKILRKWIILDWCTGEVLEDFQVIKVLDKDGPEVVYPSDIEVGMSNHSCYGVWSVTPPWLSDNCSEEVHYDLQVTAGTVLGNEVNGFTVVDLPEGTHTAYIRAYDCCGQVTTHEVTLHVVDNVPPIAVCDDRTIVSLSGNPALGNDATKLCAQSLDNGSYDNCSEVYFKMIRMDALLGTVNGSFADNTVTCGGADGDDDIIAGNQVYFDDCAHFCCEDVGEVIMVVLRVFDVDPGPGPIAPNFMNPGGRLEGRFTDCMVEVEVQDKSTPILVAPPDMVVSCMFWFDDSEDALSDPNNSVFGRVVTDINDRQKVKTTDKVCEAYCNSNAKIGYIPGSIQNGLPCDFYNNLYDPAHPDNLYDLAWGFDGYVLSNCGSDFTIRVDDRRECGQGLIIREINVQRGNTIHRAQQRIYVIDCDPFYVSDVCTDPDDHVRWPLDCRQPDELEGCGLADTSPDNPALGRPELVNGGDDNCALIIVDYKDEVYTIEPDACYKILRTWYVIDWCQYDPTDRVPMGRWEYVQVIKVLDTNDPVVTCVIGDCEPATRTVRGECEGHISLTADPEDECTPDNWLNYEYKIDIDNDGDYDVYSGPAKPGQVPANYDNPYADDEKDATDASGVYPEGHHRITWFIEDGCGNVGICDTVFWVKDCKRPTPYCKTGIITVVMPSTGSITVWASDLDAGSFDNCSDPEDLKFYFNGDPNQTGYVINCDTFTNRGASGSVLIQVQIWVEDEEGNADYCTTMIEVQDPNDVCGGTTLRPAVAGKVFTEANDYVQDVRVELEVNNVFLSERTTGRDGYFAFMNLSADNDYEVNPSKADSYLNGVSTADLVMIQRHLLGKQDLDSPYKIIAADANNTGTISAGDISELRKLILGVVAELDNVASWRFVPASHIFEDETNPWHAGGFLESITHRSLTGQQMTSDFYAVKVGDVTGDASVNGLKSNATRSDEPFILGLESATFKQGEEVEVTFSSVEARELSGYQFTIEYNQDVLELKDFRAEGLNLNESNFGFVESGVVTTSWNDFSSVEVDGDIFTLIFTAKAGGDLSESIAVNSSVTEAWAYDADLTGNAVKLAFDGREVAGSFELYQNVPNPFSHSTTIGFELPNDMEAGVTIYDVMGKVVRIIPINGQKGYNEVTVDGADLTNGRILYYQLDAGKYTATRKMILMN